MGASSLALPGLSTFTSATASARQAARSGQRDLFGEIGTYLNGAALHPLPKASVDAASAMLAFQRDRAAATRPPAPARAMLAQLINASEDEIAFMPSTGAAENAVAEALKLGPGRGVVTDGLHFEGALAMYGERARRGMPLTVVAPRDGRIRLADLEAAITPTTRLIAISEISNFNGFRHDLKALCEMAHARDVLVFADIIQSVGAIPFDVRESGVDFAAASTYKWLMGDLGFGFLYVRRDVQSEFSGAAIGWAGLSDMRIAGQCTRFDAAVLHTSWQREQGAAGLFEIGQPSNVAAATLCTSLRLLDAIGIAAIAGRRDSVRAHARRRLLTLPGFEPLTPQGATTTIEAFAVRGAKARFETALRGANITVGLFENRIRLSPSLYNDTADVDRLEEILRNV